ncbi:MAG: hypothetical protein ACRDPK_10260 [Carbonactinosporaceae bacterium]
MSFPRSAVFLRWLKVNGPAGRSPGAILFDLVLLVFTGALVLTALHEPRSDAYLVPIVVGVPTLVGVVGILMADLFPGALMRIRNGSRPTRPTVESPVGEQVSGAYREPSGEPAATGVLRPTADSLDGDGSDTQRLGFRQAIFAAWVCGFFALTAIFGVLVSIPVSLAVILRFGNRESWPVTIGLTIGVWLFVYVLFWLLLGMPL